MSQAEGEFSNYFGGEKKFVGLPDDGYSAMGGGAGNVITEEPDVMEITYQIENTDGTTDLAAPLFNASQRYSTPYNSVADYFGNSAGSSVGIVISPQDYTEAEIRTVINAGPLVIQGVVFDAGSQTQLKKRWTMLQKEGTSTATKPYDPSLKLHPSQNIQTLVIDPSFRLRVNVGTTLFIVVGKGETVKVTFKVAVSFDPSKSLNGQSVITKHGSTFARNADARLF